jgi:hypothetical protein
VVHTLCLEQFRSGGLSKAVFTVQLFTANNRFAVADYVR